MEAPQGPTEDTSAEISQVNDTEMKDSQHDNTIDDESDDVKNGATRSLPPSHILEDGRFIYLPPPNAAERSRFFERSIARHGLLEADMNKDQVKTLEEEKELKEKEEQEEKDKTAPKVHPLAVASARLQANGINELNRAINLATLVNTGEYFSYTNIVDPNLEADTAAAASSTNKSAASATSPAVATTSSSSAAESTTQRTEALYCLKRKLSQFEKASKVLQRHEKRLRAAVKAQRVIDQRLFQLRQQWRLVAPEHGTRARLHAARTTEIIAIDVDVYDRDRVHGGNRALLGNNNDSRKAISLTGRLASQVPRFATIELQDDFKAIGPQQEQGTTNEEHKAKPGATISSPSQDDSGDVEMEDDESKSTNVPNGNKKPATVNDRKSQDELTKWTRAEPFAVADPSLGRVMENFDPSKVPMLNLQLDIQKHSTGFLQSARLEPLSIDVTNGSGPDTNLSSNSDEELLVSLQHSLFCANLFESMRSELDPEGNPTSRGTSSAATPFSPIRPKTLQSMAWLASETEENFLAPPSFLVGGDAARGLASLSVIHCHEGEVKVQLDSEYQLCLKLVEANAEDARTDVQQKTYKATDGTAVTEKSGTQSPAQLHALCRAILLHAQDVHHRHSLYLRERERKKREEEEAVGDTPRGLARIKKEDIPEKARILQSCVSLGSKILFEQRIRRALSRVSDWLKSNFGETLVVEWLALSIFNLHSKFTLCCQQFVVDGVIATDSLTLTRVTNTDDYRKVHLRSENEFEAYLRLELKRQIKT
ncbi:MAG: hypothetical protein SGILL_004258 [Bacillariaceae sp.]